MYPCTCATPRQFLSERRTMSFIRLLNEMFAGRDSGNGQIRPCV